MCAVSRSHPLAEKCLSLLIYMETLMMVKRRGFGNKRFDSKRSAEKSRGSRIEECTAVYDILCLTAA